MELFARATKEQLRFTSEKGNLSVEQVWTLPLTGKSVSLQSVANTVLEEIAATHDNSFIKTTNTGGSKNKLRMDILCFIRDTKLDEAKARTESAANRQLKIKLLKAKDRKDDESIDNMSKEELDDALAKLG